MKKIMMAGLLLLTAAPAMAGPVLWKDIEAGMTMEQVAALYPAVKNKQQKVEHKTWKSKIEGVIKNGECQPISRVFYEDTNAVKFVELKPATVYEIGYGTCETSAMLGSLIGKYGEPDSQQEYIDIEPFSARRVDMLRYLWIENTVSITLETKKIGDSEWTLTYRVGTTSSEGI